MNKEEKVFLNRWGFWIPKRHLKKFNEEFLQALPQEDNDNICSCEFPVPQATMSQFCQNLGCFKLLREYSSKADKFLLQADKWISVAINKIETGVNNKLVFESGNWHSYFKIGNQTFYLSESPTKKEAEWQEEQMKTAFNKLSPKPPITKKRGGCNP